MITNNTRRFLLHTQHVNKVSNVRKFSTTAISKQDLTEIKRNQFINMKKSKEEQNTSEKKEKKSGFKTLAIGVAAGAAFVGFGYLVLNSALIETQQNVVSDLSAIEKVKTKRQLAADEQIALEEQHKQLLASRKKARELPLSESNDKLLPQIELESKRKWNAFFQRIATAFDETEEERQKREYESVKDRVLRQLESEEGYSKEQRPTIKQIVQD